MNLPRLSKWLTRIIYISIILAFFTPLILDPNYLFPFISSKLFIFRSLIEIGFGAYVILAFIDPSARPKRNALTLFITVYVVVVGIAVITGVNPMRSFWGTVERGEGYITLLHLYALYIMFVGVVRERKQWLTLFIFSFTVSVLTALYGFAQLFGAEGVINTTGERLSSTIGNASFLAGYLMVHVFIGLYLLYSLRNKWFKALIGLGGAINIFIIFQTQTRGAVIGLLAGLIILALLFVCGKRQHIPRVQRNIWTGILVVIILAAGAVWFFRSSAAVTQSRVFHRYADISLSDITTQSRLLTWQASYKAFTERPFFGWGYENYTIAFDTQFPTDIYKDSGSQIWFDRAHNILFDQLIMNGAIGFVAYVSIAIIVLIYLFRIAQREQPEGVFAYSIIALVAAYGIQNMFVFDTLPVYISLIMILGYVSWWYGKEKQDQQTPSTLSIPSFVLGVTSFVIVCLVVASIVMLNIKPARENLIGARGLRAFQDGFAYKSLQLLDNARAMNTNQSNDLMFQFSFSASQSKQKLRENKEIGEQAFRRAQEYARMLIEREPLNARYYLLLLAVNNAAHGVFDTPLEEMEELARIALERAPTRPHIYFELAQAYLNSERIDDALLALERARQLSPRVGTVYRNLMLAYSRHGDWQSVRKVLDTVIDDTKHISIADDDIEFILDLLDAGERYDDLVVFYEWLTQERRTKGEHFAQLAALYAMVNDFEHARQAVEEAVRRDPNLEQESKLFLQIIAQQEQERN